MKDISYKEYQHAGARYSIVLNQSAESDVSCIIVEDDPGPYLEFVQMRERDQRIAGPGRPCRQPHRPRHT